MLAYTATYSLQEGEGCAKPTGSSTDRAGPHPDGAESDRHCIVEAPLAAGAACVHRRRTPGGDRNHHDRCGCRRGRGGRCDLLGAVAVAAVGEAALLAEPGRVALPAPLGASRRVVGRQGWPRTGRSPGFRPSVARCDIGLPERVRTGGGSVTAVIVHGNG